MCVASGVHLSYILQKFHEYLTSGLTDHRSLEIRRGFIAAGVVKGVASDPKASSTLARKTGWTGTWPKLRVRLSRKTCVDWFSLFWFFFRKHIEKLNTKFLEMFRKHD